MATSRAIELHMRHLPGGMFTDHVFGAMKEKDILRIEGPFGSFFLREDSDKPMVLLASGTGFAPIKAIIEHMQLEAQRAAGRAVLGLPHARPTSTCTSWAERGGRASCRTCATCRCSPSRSPRTTGPAAPASSTRP